MTTETQEKTALELAVETVDSIEAWVGWDSWHRYPGIDREITLDGGFTIKQLAALVLVLSDDIENLKPEPEPDQRIAAL